MAKKKDAKSKGELMEQDQDALEVIKFYTIYFKQKLIPLIIKQGVLISVYRSIM